MFFLLFLFRSNKVIHSTSLRSLGAAGETINIKSLLRCQDETYVNTFSSVPSTLFSFTKAVRIGILVI